MGISKEGNIYCKEYYPNSLRRHCNRLSQHRSHKTPICHDHANSIPIWTNSTLLLVYSNVPTSYSDVSTPTPTFLLLLQHLAFPSCSCHSFRYIPHFLLSPTCQSVTLLPPYPFHVFSPFHMIPLLHFFDTVTWLVFITRILSFQSVYKSSCNSSVLQYEYQLGLVLILLLCLILSNSSNFPPLQSPPLLCLLFLCFSEIQGLSLCKGTAHKLKPMPSLPMSSALLLGAELPSYRTCSIFIRPCIRLAPPPLDLSLFLQSSTGELGGDCSSDSIFDPTPLCLALFKLVPNLVLLSMSRP